MSVLIDIKQQFVDSFNADSGLSLTYSDLKVQGPVAVDATYPPAYRTKNTVITFSYQDKILNVSYDRIAIENTLGVPGGVTIALPFDTDGTTHKLLDEVSKRLGEPITPLDIVNETFDVSKLPGTIELTVASTSLRWLPGTKLLLNVKGTYRIVDGVCEQVPLVFSYTPDSYEAEGVAVNQKNGLRTHPVFNTGQFDYTPIAHLFRNLRSLPTYSTTGANIINLYTINNVMVEALRSVDNIPWIITTNVAYMYNLYAAWVVYNGPTEGAKAALIRSYTVDPNELVAALDIRETEFDNVMLLRLNTTYNTKSLPALLPIHYNNTP